MLEGPPLKETTDPKDVNLAQQTLASKIREVRKTARQGDIFPPLVAGMFKQLMNPELRGVQGRETKQAITDEAPTTKEVPLVINAGYTRNRHRCRRFPRNVNWRACRCSRRTLSTVSLVNT